MVKINKLGSRPVPREVDPNLEVEEEVVKAQPKGKKGIVGTVAISGIPVKENSLDSIRIIKGIKGDIGRAGKNGLNGKDGLDGKDGRNGKCGIDGKDGLDGARGPKGDSFIGKFGVFIISFIVSFTVFLLSPFLLSLLNG